jgi:hypothetical protein
MQMRTLLTFIVLYFVAVQVPLNAQETIDWTSLGKQIAATLTAKAGLAAPKTVAVIPFSTDGQGVYYLGDLLARRIEAGLVGQANVQVVTRRELDKLLQEKNLGFSDLTAQGRQEDAMKWLKADLLVAGRTTPTADCVHVDCEMVDAAGRILATAAIRSGLPMNDEVRGLLRWQQRPASVAAGQAQAPVAELCLDYSFDCRTNGLWRQLRDDAGVRTGEKFWLRVRPQSDCFVYLLLFDSAGKAEVLFPHPQIHRTTQLRGGVLYTFPSPSVGYKLVPPTGTEQLWLVASYEPLTQLGNLIQELRTGADADAVSQHIRKHVQEVATRGLPSAEQEAPPASGGYAVRGLPPSGLRSVALDGDVAGDENPPPMLQCNGGSSALVKLTFRHE